MNVIRTESRESDMLEECKEPVETFDSVWRCKKCTFLNQDIPNYYECQVCESFQPRTPENFDLNRPFHELDKFPDRAPSSYLLEYYRFNIWNHANCFPEEIVSICSSFLHYSFKVGDRIDIRYQNVWYTGSVIGAQGGKIRISYEGWSERWDEWVDFDSFRVDVYRSRSVGDTSASATRHLFRPRVFCPDANMMYEFRQMGYTDMEMVHSALHMARNQRHLALRILESDV